MASITISVQSLLNAALYDSYTLDDSSTVGDLMDLIQTETGVNPDWYVLSYNDVLLDVPVAPLTDYSIVNGSVLRSGNIIATLATLQDRQLAKLNLAVLDRTYVSNPYNTYDINLLPSQYIGNTSTPNDHPDGLVEGRPWVITGITFDFSAFGSPPYAGGNQIEDPTGTFNPTTGFTINDGGAGSGVAFNTLTTEQQTSFSNSAYKDGYVWNVSWGPGSTYASTPVALYYERFGPGSLVFWILDPSDLTYSTPVPSGTFNFPALFVEGTTPTSFAN